MNRWYFWVLAPVMLATGLGLPFIVQPPSWRGYVVLYMVCGTLVLATLGLANPRRFSWALTSVAGAIVIAYVAYVAYEAFAWWHGKPFGAGSRRSASNLRNALTGLAVFGLPALYFMLRGRFHRTRRPRSTARPSRAKMRPEDDAVEQADAADEAQGGTRTAS